MNQYKKKRNTNKMHIISIYLNIYSVFDVCLCYPFGVFRMTFVQWHEQEHLLQC